MDPTACLKRIRELTDVIEQALMNDITDEAAELAELVDNLDGWLSKGGFLPEQWKRRSDGFVHE